MTSLIEVLAATAIAGTLTFTGTEVMSQLDEQAQQVAFSVQIENAADCAQVQFAMYGVSTDVGIQQILDDPAGDLATRVVRCYSDTPFAGVDELNARLEAAGLDGYAHNN